MACPWEGEQRIPSSDSKWPRTPFSARICEGLKRQVTWQVRSTQTKDKANKAKDAFTSEKMDAIIDLW